MSAAKEEVLPWLGQTPADWKIKPLYALGLEVRALNRGLVEDNLLSLSYGEIKRKDIEANFGLLPESFETYQVVEAGDVVFRFTYLQNDQKSLRSALVKQRGIITNAYVGFRPKGIDSRYFDYLMRAYDLAGVFYSMGSGLRQSLNYSDFRRLPVVVPPGDGQRRIADFLDRETAKIDALIAKQEQLITTLDERRGAVISRAVTRGLVEDRPLRDSGVEWLGRVPADWDVKPIRSLMKFNTEKNAGNKSRNYLSLMANVGVIPYDEKGSVGNKSPEDLEKCKIVRTGDFVLNSMNFGIGSFGVSPYDGICSTVYVVMTPKPGVSSPSFLKHIFSMKAFQKHAQSLGYGILEHRAAIGWHDLKNLGFPVPPLAEQTKIANYLDDETARIDELRAEATRMTRLLAERRQALISAAVTGKLEVGV